MTTRRVLPEDLADTLASARDLHGLSQRTLGRRVGVSGQFVSLIEKGERCPSAPVATALARELHLPPDITARLAAASRIPRWR